jgi:hypothetical protein
MKTRYVELIGTFGCTLLILLLAGCTPNVKGVYTCEGGLLDEIRLESGGKAYVSATMLGQKSERAGTYSVDADKVNIVTGDDSTMFTLKDKTLDGGSMAGRCTAK